jgi:GT2 family glycosyltransferase
VDALLASLAGQTVRPSAVLLVDDTEGDAVERVAARHPHATYVRNPGPRSAAGARNVGARHPAAAGADLLTFLDSDSVLEPDYLERIQDVLRERPDALGAMGYVTGQKRNNRFQNSVAALFGLSRPSSRRAWLSPSLYSLYPLDIAEVTETNWLWGCNLTVRRPAFDAVGGFHPQMLRYSYLEDLELGLHLLQAHPGRTLVMTPHARLRHRKSPADRLSTLDTERMRIVHRNLIVRRYMPRRWYRGPQVLWSDLGTILIKHYRRPWEVPAQLWNLVATWALVLRYRKDLDRGDLGRINRHYRFARKAGQPAAGPGRRAAAP